MADKYRYQITTVRTSNGRFKSKMNCDGVPMAAKSHSELYDNIFVPVSEAQKKALKGCGRLEKITTEFSSYLDLRKFDIKITT